MFHIGLSKVNRLETIALQWGRGGCKTGKRLLNKNEIKLSNKYI